MLCYGPLLDVVQLRRVAGDILARLNSSGCGYVRMIQYSAMRSRATVWPVMKIILPVSLDAEDICTPTHRLASARRARPVLLDRVLWLQASFCQSFPYSKGRWSHATSKVDSSIRSGTIMNHLSLEMSIPLGCFLVHMTLPPPVSPRATTLDTHTHTKCFHCSVVWIVWIASTRRSHGKLRRAIVVDTERRDLEKDSEATPMNWNIDGPPRPPRNMSLIGPCLIKICSI